MAFNKFANASVIRPSITTKIWDEVRANAVALGSAFDSRRAANVVLQKYNPNQFLLSHCTIIASVDTEEPGLPMGSQMVEGNQIDRRYADWMVSSDTSKFINNNNDCWERKLLMACFRTFVGGENYVEHLQIPELSKGKIIDAAARDIGDSVYVDILVATDRKHAPLIAAVQSGELQTLSMGCQVQFTICTKCGNTAEDETKLCRHIRYMKGNTFLDGRGRPRKIAELCGHINSEPGSVRFIEASWVANPAFTGAVLRNILSPKELAMAEQRIQVAFRQPARVADPNLMSRAAHMNLSGYDLLSLQSQQLPRVIEKTFHYPKNPGRTTVTAQGWGDGEEDAPPAVEEEAANPMDLAVDEMVEHLREKAVAKLRGEMAQGEIPSADLKENRNETLIKEAVRKSPQWRGLAQVVMSHVKSPTQARRMLLGLIHYKSGGWQAVRLANQFSGRDILALSRLLDIVSQAPGIAGEARVYRTVTAVGGVSAYEDVQSFLAACRRVLGRNLTGSETDALVTKGRLFDLGHSDSPYNPTTGQR